MVSNLPDMAKYVKTLSVGNGLLDHEMTVARQNWQKCETGIGSQDTVNGRPVETAYGFGLLNYGGGVGHSGGILGYNNVAVYFPAKDVTVVMMVNNDKGTAAFLRSYNRICAVLFGEEFPFAVFGK